MQDFDRAFFPHNINRIHKIILTNMTSHPRF